MTKLSRNRLASGLVFLAVLGATFILSRKESWDYIPTGLARQGAVWLAVALLGSSFSLWKSGRWLDPGPWGKDDIGRVPRFGIYSRIFIIGHAAVYVVGFVFFILGL